MEAGLGFNWHEEEPTVDGGESFGTDSKYWTVMGGEYDRTRITISPDRLARIDHEAMSYPDSARTKKMALELVGYAAELADPRLTFDEERAAVAKEKVISAVIKASKYSQRTLTTRIRELASQIEGHDIPVREALRDIINNYNRVHDGHELDDDAVALSQGTLSLLLINERGFEHELPEPDRYSLQ
jgi:hypothetical protein